MIRNIAFLMIDVQDLSGAGGAERFFFDFLNRNNSDDNRMFNIYLLTNNSTNLSNVSYNAINPNYLHVFELYRNKWLKGVTDKLGIVGNLFSFLREMITFIPLYRFCYKRKIEVLHIPLYEKKDYFLIYLFDKFSFLKRPKISFSIVDCRIPYRYFSNDSAHYYSSHLSYEKAFNTIRIDGVLSWYKLFEEFNKTHSLIKSDPKVYSVTSRYSIIDEMDCWDSKKNVIVFAGRLDDQKDPEFFVKAVEKVIRNGKDANYQFFIYGKGPLKDRIQKYINENGLAEKIKMDYNPKMKAVFLTSKAFVSTQLYENFPSMSMAEAMACENVIIAKNVGQTDYFVKNNENGFLVDENNLDDLAEKISEFISLDEQQKRVMGKYSASLLRNVHNFKNFQAQFNNYVLSLL